jgi:hypothetical protein
MLFYSKVFKYERITRCPAVMPYNENRRQQAVLTPLFLYLPPTLADPVVLLQRLSVYHTDKEWQCRVLGGQCRPLTLEAQV